MHEPKKLKVSCSQRIASPDFTSMIFKSTTKAYNSVINRVFGFKGLTYTEAIFYHNRDMEFISLVAVARCNL